jgi:hypothetical protein
MSDNPGSISEWLSGCDYDGSATKSYDVPPQPNGSRYPIDPLRAAKKDDWYAHCNEQTKNSPMFSALRASVQAILAHPRDFRWTVQGFGMIRTYFGANSKQYRLNVWDHHLKVPGVSTVHDHPWDFESWVLSGELINTRYVEDPHSGDEYQYMIIKTGEGGHADSDPFRIRLRPTPTERYQTGDTYRQAANEIHETNYSDGTVTLNARVGDTEKARVFWADDCGKGYWVDAKPREATGLEVSETTAWALDHWQ